MTEEMRVADNRMWLVHSKDSSSRILLAKHYGGTWSVYHADLSGILDRILEFDAQPETGWKIVYDSDD